MANKLEILKIKWYSCQKIDYHICDPTQINEADVVRGPNCDFADNVFLRNQESF